MTLIIQRREPDPSLWERLQPAYGQIVAHYGYQRAARSDVPLINHIREGVKIMWRLNASDYAIRAYCLHPLFQADIDLVMVDPAGMNPIEVMLAMEYRSCANRWLSDKVRIEHFDDGVEVGRKVVFDGEPSAGPLDEVKQMLIADKVQNYKDFLQYHQHTHPRSLELQQYFKAWLIALNVTDEEFEELSQVDAT